MSDQVHANDPTSDQARREVDERIRAVLEEAPSDASAELEVRKSKLGYQGILKIYSQQRKFVGGGEGRRFSEVVENLFREVREQIKDWRRDRFLTLNEAPTEKPD